MDRVTGNPPHSLMFLPSSQKGLKNNRKKSKFYPSQGTFLDSQYPTGFDIVPYIFLKYRYLPLLLPLWTPSILREQILSHVASCWVSKKGKKGAGGSILGHPAQNDLNFSPLLIKKKTLAKMILKYHYYFKAVFVLFVPP